MNPEFLEILAGEDAVESEFHKKLLQHCQSLVEMSRRYMDTSYTAWDRNFDVYRGLRTLDRDDKDAQGRKEP